MEMAVHDQAGAWQQPNWIATSNHANVHWKPPPKKDQTKRLSFKSKTEGKVGLGEGLSRQEGEGKRERGR